MNLFNELDKTEVSKEIVDKSSSFLGMLFPYVGIKKKAVDMYIDDIKNSNLPEETKVFMVLNTKKNFKRIKNQKSIAKIAIQNAKESIDFSEQSGVDEEWLDRFMESAGFVSSKEIQLIWGKILANKFEKPNSIPPNMIRVLSEITPELAKAFRCICSMYIRFYHIDEKGNIEKIVTDIVVPYNEKNSKKFSKMGLGFHVLNELDTLGLIKFTAVGDYETNEVNNQKILVLIDNNLEMIEKHKNGKLTLGCVMLTSVGKALKAITDPVEIEDYYEMVIDYMKEKNIVFAENHNYKIDINGNVVKNDE